MKITIFTIGTNKKSAKDFFDCLMCAGVGRVIDVRLHNTSQLLGFSKRDDVEYFLKQVAHIKYSEEPLFRPTQAILAAYRAKKITWQEYEARFSRLMKDRRIENVFVPASLDNCCLLCSESEPSHCHRRLVAEHLEKHWHGVHIRHL
jgi:uncharacterized protein (DUF488 family)